MVFHSDTRPQCLPLSLWLFIPIMGCFSRLFLWLFIPILGRSCQVCLYNFPFQYWSVLFTPLSTTFHPSTGAELSCLSLRLLIRVTERTFHACLYGFLTQYRSGAFMLVSSAFNPNIEPQFSRISTAFSSKYQYKIFTTVYTVFHRFTRSQLSRLSLRYLIPAQKRSFHARLRLFNPKRDCSFHTRFYGLSSKHWSPIFTPVCMAFHPKHCSSIFAPPASVFFSHSVLERFCGRWSC